MAKFTDDYVLDGAGARLAEGNALHLTEGQPASYMEASDPPAWAAATAYALGNVRRPTARNGFVYEVTTAGTSGAAEPTWPTTVGTTVTDGTVTWTTRANGVLGVIALTPGRGNGDFTAANGDVSGRKVTVTAQTGIDIVFGGTADHVVIVDTVNSRLLGGTTVTAQVVTAGNTANTAAFDFEFADPTP